MENESLGFRKIYNESIEYIEQYYGVHSNDSFSVSSIKHKAYDCNNCSLQEEHHKICLLSKTIFIKPLYYPVYLIPRFFNHKTDSGFVDRTNESWITPGTICPGYNKIRDLIGTAPMYGWVSTDSDIELITDMNDCDLPLLAIQKRHRLATTDESGKIG